MIWYYIRRTEDSPIMDWSEMPVCMRHTALESCFIVVCGLCSDILVAVLISQSIAKPLLWALQLDMSQNIVWKWLLEQSQLQLFPKGWRNIVMYSLFQRWAAATSGRLDRWQLTARIVHDAPVSLVSMCPSATLAICVEMANCSLYHHISPISLVS